MKIKKLNVTICGYELYVIETAPIEKIRRELKKHEKTKLPNEFNKIFPNLGLQT